MNTDSTLILDLYKELLKGTISLPLEGCKSMGTGCATVASLYGAVLAFVNYGHRPQVTDLKAYIILGPFVLLAIAGLYFGVTYLPNVRLIELLKVPSPFNDPRAQEQILIAREEYIRTNIVKGSKAFWFGLAWAILNVAFIRLP
jgi:hypothetical protein